MMGGSVQNSPEPADALVEAAAAVQSLAELAELLRALRRRHARAHRDSSLTYRELAQRSGWSQAAIAEYFTGRTLPPTDRFDALLEVLGAATSEQRALAGARDRVEENQRRARPRRPARPARPAAPSAPAASTAPSAPDTRSDSTQPQARPVTAPRQLPGDTALFTGRDDELGQLLALTERTLAEQTPGAAAIAVIDGMGGIGKTALAVHAGHRLAPHFPDGQLFLDLYGFAPDRPAREPGDALAELLSALGVPPQRIPAQTEARAALYRDRLALTRTLVVLDNAADEAQVRPLVPAAAGCLVLVTSRRRLKAFDDAVPLPLDVLPPDLAVTLLRRAARVHSPSNPAQDARWERAAELCGHLPLALAIAGALLRTGGKAWDLQRLIDRLTARRPGDELAGYTDETRSLTAVFGLSYRQLPEQERLLLRRLGLLPGAEIDAHAAAALLDADPDAADRLLEHLADHSLLIGADPGRYRVHDLVHAHARSLAVNLDPDPERAAARDRLLHYYAYTAQTASLLVARYPRPEPDGEAPAHVPELPDPDAARAWLRAELPNLTAAHAHARGRGLAEHELALAAGMAEILRADGPWNRCLEIHQAAAETARRCGRSASAAQATALTDLGRVRFVSDDYPGAGEAHAQALEIYRALGHRLGEANSLHGLGRVRYLSGDYPAAHSTLTRALEIYRVLGHRLGEASALAELARVGSVTGDFPEAEDAATQALEIYREIGHRQGEATVLGDLGVLRSLAGDYRGAGEATRMALDIYSRSGIRHGEAVALTGLGRVCYMLGDYPGATDALARALEIYEEIGSRQGWANALTHLGRVRSLTGDHAGAEDALTQALQTYREIGDRADGAWALNHYAATLATAGRHRLALAPYQEALAVHRELNKPDDEAVSLEGIGECHFAEGDSAQGAAHLNQALAIYRRLGMRADVDRVQARLDNLCSDRVDGPQDPRQGRAADRSERR